MNTPVSQGVPNHCTSLMWLLWRSGSFDFSLYLNRFYIFMMVNNVVHKYFDTVNKLKDVEKSEYETFQLQFL